MNPIRLLSLVAAIGALLAPSPAPAQPEKRPAAPARSTTIEKRVRPAATPAARTERAPAAAAPRSAPVPERAATPVVRVPPAPASPPTTADEAAREAAPPRSTAPGRTAPERPVTERSVPAAARQEESPARRPPVTRFPGKLLTADPKEEAARVPATGEASRLPPRPALERRPTLPPPGAGEPSREPLPGREPGREVETPPEAETVVDERDETPPFEEDEPGDVAAPAPGEEEPPSGAAPDDGGTDAPGAAAVADVRDVLERLGVSDATLAATYEDYGVEEVAAWGLAVENLTSDLGVDPQALAALSDAELALLGISRADVDAAVAGAGAAGGEAYDYAATDPAFGEAAYGENLYEEPGAAEAFGDRVTASGFDKLAGFLESLMDQTFGKLFRAIGGLFGDDESGAPA